MKFICIILAVSLCLFARLTTAQRNDFEKGNEAYRNRDYHSAIGYYNKYLNQSKQEVPLLLFRRGDAFLKLGKFKEAINDFNRLISISPTYEKAHYYRGLAHQSLGYYEMAIRDFYKELAQVQQRKNSDSLRIEPLKRISDCYRSMGNHEKAKECAEEAVALEVAIKKSNPNNLPTSPFPLGNGPNGHQQREYGISDAQRMLSEARALAEQSKYAECEQKCTQVIQLNHVEKNLLKEAYDLRGTARIRMKDYAGAIQDFDQSLKINTKDAWTLNQRGIAKTETGLFDEAEQDFKTAIQIDLNSPAKENLNLLNVRRKRFISANDFQGPVVTIISPQLTEENSRGLSNVYAYNNTVTIVGIVEDPSGVREVQINTIFAKLTSIDSTGRRLWFTATIPVKEYGKNVIQLIAKDAANNTTERSYSYFATGGLPSPIADKYNARRLLGNNYALIIATDQYGYWSNLSNPVYDAKALAEILEKNYGFKVEMLLNPASKADIEYKLKQCASRSYNYNDQLLVFIAGHGYFHEHLKKGFIIPANGLPSRADLQGNTWVSHEFIRTTLDLSTCRHILLIIDACFSGTISSKIAWRGDENTLSMYEMVASKMQLKTRKYLTSGGKEYVPDGEPGKHSPFAATLLDLLKSKGRFRGGMLTIQDIRIGMQNLVPQPHCETFDHSSGDPEGEFFFIPVEN
ncbi:MAG: tetratricopeptide repeat protein [Cytophagales bacterium]|nr:tetratricopeptide repeat protein [Bernardetiaceae bacterium]MDW8204580.1 tetratricopeptide repeat protein [Cytophagales bacterium]